MTTKDSEIIQLTGKQLRLILEHAGVILDEREFKKDETRIKKEELRKKFYTSKVGRIFAIGLLFVLMGSFLTYMFCTNDEAINYSALVFSIVFIIIFFLLPLLLTLVFWGLNFKKLYLFLEYATLSIISGTIVGYCYNSIMNELLTNLNELGWIVILSGSKLETEYLAFMLMMLIGLGSNIILYNMLKALLVIKHKKWKFLCISWMWVEILLFSIFLGGNIFLLTNSVSYFLNIIIIAFFNIVTIFRFDEKTFELYTLRFRDIFQYMPKL
jgi:hypothetical protein